MLALPAEAQDPERTDTRIREAWSYLLPDEQAEVIEWFRLEISVRDTFQNRCLRFVLEAQESDPGFWPLAAEATWFDPEEHAPAQPIPRRRLDPKSSSATRMRDAVNRARPPRKLQSAWAYDWATGGLVRLGETTPEMVLENALAGFPPDLDLAEVLVLRQLDTGEERAALGAFEHAYSDRVGNVFPITLYEAWSAGVEIEMPDVDTLGIVHTVLDDWRKWKAPVPPRQHRELYATIGDIFAGARRYRGLREALAAAYLSGSPAVRDGYRESLVRFHALWDKHASTPANVLPELPRSPEDWTDFLQELADECEKDRDLREAGKRRQAALDADAATVRATLVWVLEQFGAFERKRKPDPPPPKEPKEKEEPEKKESRAVGPSPWPPWLPDADADDPKAIEKALKAFRKLRPGRRAELEELLHERVTASDAPQGKLVADMIAGIDAAGVDAAVEYDAHDGRKYGGGKRRLVKSNSRKWKDLAEEIADPDPPRALQAAYVYDFAAGAVGLRVPGKGEEARVFENGLAGFAPRQDLAEALLLAKLDAKRHKQKEARFFWHLYADLNGKCFQDITLFDVWSHEIPVDVPDVDVRAYAEIVHAETALPPILRAADKEQWYPSMASSLFALRRHVLIARAIAACWFDGRPNLRGGYAQSVDTMHATFGLEGADLDRVVGRFENLGQRFVEQSLADVNAGGAAAWDKGNDRRQRLLDGRELIRTATLAVLRENGLLK